MKKFITFLKYAGAFSVPLVMLFGAAYMINQMKWDSISETYADEEQLEGPVYTQKEEDDEVETEKSDDTPKEGDPIEAVLDGADKDMEEIDVFDEL